MIMQFYYQSLESDLIVQQPRRHKVTKSHHGRRASLPHLAFALQIGLNRGCASFALLRSLISHASANLTMPCSHTRPALFSPISPEAGSVSEALLKPIKAIKKMHLTYYQFITNTSLRGTKQSICYTEQTCIVRPACVEIATFNDKGV